MTIAVSSIGSGRLAIDITGVASAASGGQGALANPEGCSVHITRAHLLVKTTPGGSANLGIGVVAAITTKGTDVLNDDAMNGTTEDAVIDCFALAGAKTELATAVWTAAKFLTFTASATLADFTGTLFLEYIRTPPE